MAKAKRTKKARKPRDYEVQGEPSHADDGDVGAWEAVRGDRVLDIYLEKHPAMGRDVTWRRTRIFRATAHEMRPRSVGAQLIPAATFAEACQRVRRINAAALGSRSSTPAVMTRETDGATRAARRAKTAAKKAAKKAPAKAAKKAPAKVAKKVAKKAPATKR